MKTKTKIYILLGGITVLVLLFSMRYIPTDKLVKNFTENTLVADIRQFLNLYNENKLLEERIASIEQLKIENQLVQSDNSELEKMKQAVERYKNYQPLVATVIYRDFSSENSQNWFNSLTLSVGENQGIKKNMPVISPEGLIGLIKTVHKDTAEVELITSNQKRSYIPATFKDDQSVFGMIESYDPENNLIKMTRIETNKEIKVGSIVTTSQKSTYFPANLEIGEVIEVKKDNYGLTNTASVKPAVHYYDINYVLVLQNPK